MSWQEKNELSLRGDLDEAEFENDQRTNIDKLWPWLRISFSVGFLAAVFYAICTGTLSQSNYPINNHGGKWGEAQHEGKPSLLGCVIPPFLSQIISASISFGDL